MKRFSTHALTRAALSATLLAMPLAGAGCQGARLAQAYTQADDFKAFVGVAHAADPAADPADPVTPGTLYRVAPPDTLHITVLRGGAAVDHRVTLPPDGRLLLPGLAWPVETTGLTPGEIARDLQRALHAQIARDAPTDPDADPALAPDPDRAPAPAPPVGPLANQPLDLDPAPIAQAQRAHLGGADPAYVAVRVDGFSSRRVFVFGQVTEPGAQAWDGTNRLASVLANARPGHRADLTRVLVLRPGPDGDPRRRLVIPAQRLLDAGDNTLDVALDPGDVVFVPATPLGRVGLALDRLRPHRQADAAGPGGRPAPVFPEIALIARADAVATPLERAGHARRRADGPAAPPVLVSSGTADANPSPDANPDANPNPAAHLADAGGAAHAAVDPLAVAVAGVPTPTLLPIRADTPAYRTAPSAAAAAARRADTDDAVRFWAP